MNKLAVSSDSGTILPQEANKLGFSMIPVPIIMDGKTYLDTEVDMDELYARLEARENMPQTSTANIGEFSQFFTDLSQDAEGVLHISMSSRFSGHHQVAQQGKEAALKEMPEKKIEIIDSLTMGTGVAFLATEAARAAQQGKDLAKVTALINDIIPQLNLFLARDTLFYQAEGGRIFEAKTWAEAEQTQSFRTITEVDGTTGGTLKPVARAKTPSQIMEKMVEMTKERGKDQKLVGLIGHTRAPERAEKLKERLLKELDFDRIHVAEESASVAIHTGKGLIGLAFSKLTA